MTTKAEKEQEKTEAVRDLRKMLKPGDTVYCILRHVSSSGMSRRIDLYVMKKNRPVWLSWYAARVLGERLHKESGIVVGGCGMDMGFHLVYSLSRVLFPNGFIPAKAGRSHGRNGSAANERDNDGGYALNHKWL